MAFIFLAFHFLVAWWRTPSPCTLGKEKWFFHHSFSAFDYTPWSKNGFPVLQNKQVSNPTFQGMSPGLSETCWAARKRKLISSVYFKMPVSFQERTKLVFHCFQINTIELYSVLRESEMMRKVRPWTKCMLLSRRIRFKRFDTGSVVQILKPLICV